MIITAKTQISFPYSIRLKTIPTLTFFTFCQSIFFLYIRYIDFIPSFKVFLIFEQIKNAFPDVQIFLATYFVLCYIRFKGNTAHKVEASVTVTSYVRTLLSCFADRIGFFYFLLFLLSRKARNATIKLPKVANSVSIPMKIDMISNAVIVTHLPSYVFR